MLTFSIPLGAFYFALFAAGLLIGALGARWVYRPGRVRVPYRRPPVPPEPGRGYQPEPDYPRPPTPPAPPPRAP